MTTGHAVVTLVVFIISVFFVIHPIPLPIPRSIPRISVNLVTAPILAITLLWATRCIDPAIIRHGITGTEGVKPYNVMILFFSLAYIAITLDITGIIRAAAFWVSNRGGSNGWRLYFYFYITFTVLSIFLGSDPVAHSGTVFLVHYTANTGLDADVWTMNEFSAINTARMVLFIGNPTNLIICEAFGINNATFTAYTILPFLASNICCLVALALQCRKQVPGRLSCSFDRKPQEVLLDSVGAWVGSFTLGAAVILCIVISFFGIDAWKLSLPLALSKFLFDLSWDYYRYSHRIPMFGRRPHTTVRASTFEKDEPMVTTHSASSFSSVIVGERLACAVLPGGACEPITAEPGKNSVESTPPRASEAPKMSRSLRHYGSFMDDLHDLSDQRFPTFVAALPRLPFSFVASTFSQFVLVEALDHQGWINTFANWLVRASQNRVHPTIWLIGVLGVIFCSLLGTNIGATIFLTKVIRASSLSNDATRSAAVALGVASNIGGIGFTFSASFTGLLFRSILEREGKPMEQKNFAFRNLFPLLVTTAAGLAIVSAEMAVLFSS